MARLTHFDAEGKAAMVDISTKDETERVAVRPGARSDHATSDPSKLVAAGNMKKGDVLAVARLAGIMAAKRTSELIPLCHPVALHQYRRQSPPSMRSETRWISKRHASW